MAVYGVARVVRNIAPKKSRHSSFKKTILSTFTSLQQFVRAQMNEAEQTAGPRADRPTAAAGGAAAQSPAKKPVPLRKKLAAAVAGAIMLLAVVAGGTLYWLHARQFESTDDAAIDGYISQVSPRIAGAVIRLDVADNQRVVAGQPVADIDPRDYQIKLDQALAQQAQSRAAADQAHAALPLQNQTILQSAAQLQVTQADLAQAQQDQVRFRSIDPKAITSQQLDTANTAVRTARARHDANRAAMAAAVAQLDVDQAQIANAEATARGSDEAVRNAALQLSYTHIIAPVAGRVTQRTVDTGNYVTPGQVLLYIVPNGMWVTANFKETQLALMHQGQPATLMIDALPGQTFHGHVNSFQAGTGDAFSTLPAENATGNYVKVLQRVPVKITLDDANNPALAPGLSVIARVKVQ